MPSGSSLNVALCGLVINDVILSDGPINESIFVFSEMTSNQDIRKKIQHFYRAMHVVQNALLLS